MLGDNGEMGYSFTTGTTGGAAYAIAIGSKPRRDAMVSLITYGDDGRPAGLQAVTLQTNGSFVVGEYVELGYELEPDEEGYSSAAPAVGSGGVATASSGFFCSDRALPRVK